MKKTTILLAVLFISTIVFGQEKGTRDLSINVGIVTSNGFLNSVETMFSDVISNVKTKNDKEATPAIGITYKYAVKDNWFVYADGVYQVYKADLVTGNTEIGDVNHTYLTLGLGTEYHYIVKDIFQMYSGGSIAFTSQSSKFKTSSSSIKDNSDSFLNFQVNVFGFRVGKRLAATLELGYGYKGIVNLGVSYQF